MPVLGALRTSTNLRGVQSASAVDEVLSAITLCTRGLKNWTFILPDAYTKAQLDELLVYVPTVTGTKVITYSGTAGYTAMSAGERTTMVAAFLAKGYTLN